MIKKALFLGSKQFGLETLKLIHKLTPELVRRVITCDDRNDSRNRMDEFKAYCQENQLDLSISKSKLETHELIAQYQPDFCFVNGWYQILPEKTLAIPQFGFVGIHHSLLPKYRGGSPLVWQILNNEKELGTSIFYFNNGVDSGEIIFQTSIVNNDLYINDARELLEEKLLVELKFIWPKIISNKTNPTPQEHSDASYCAQLTEADGEIEWNDLPENILSGIRARSLPYPCAYFFYQEQKIKVVRAKLFEGIYYGRPGQLVAFEEKSGYPILSCGDGRAIVIEKILDQNEQSVDAQLILNSTKIRLLIN